MTDKLLSADYGTRDERIQCQTYSPVRKLDGLPHDLFSAYWRDVHGPLCSRLPGLDYYVQHHFSRERFDGLFPLAENVRRMELVLDGAVEIGFADPTRQARFTKASPVLFGDEFNLFSHAVAYNLPQGSRTLIDRRANGIPNGSDQIHRLHLYLNGDSQDSFQSWVADWAAKMAAAPDILKLRLHLPELYDNARPSPPSPGVNHQVSDERKDIAIIEIGFENALTARLFFESELFKATVGEQSKHLRSVGVFLVTGIYTFIRDGILTTAGLRGSRTAELINQIGAVNQTQTNVTSLFQNSQTGSR
jgi:EthD domain